MPDQTHSSATIVRRRLLALSPWILLGVAYTLPAADLASPAFLAYGPALIGLALLASIVLIWRFGFFSPLSALLYVVFLPIWLPTMILFRALTAPWHLWTWARSHYSGTRATGLAVVLVLASTTIVLMSSERLILYSTAMALGLLVVGLWFFAFWRVLAPSSLVLRLVNRILAMALPAWDKLVSVKDNRPATPSEAYGTLKMLERYAGRFQSVVTFLLTPRASVLSFLGIFLFTFCAIVCVYGLGYLALWKADPSLFTPVRKPNLTDSVFFSLTTITTSAISDLSPSEALSKWVVASELLVGLTLVSLLALSFSSLYHYDAEVFRTRWKALEDAIESRLYYLREHTIDPDPDEPPTEQPTPEERYQIPFGGRHLRVGSRIVHGTLGVGVVLGAWNHPTDPHVLVKFKGNEIHMLKAKETDFSLMA